MQVYILFIEEVSIMSNRNRRKKNKNRNKLKKLTNHVLMEEGMNKVNTSRSDNTQSSTVPTVNRDTPKDYLNAIKTGNLDEVTRLYNKGISYYEYTSLATAAVNGHINIIEFLVSKGANIKRNYNGALREASSNNMTDVVKYLVENGSMTSNNNRSILIGAVRNNNLELVKFLLDNGANTKCNLKYALKESLMRNYKNIAEYLMSLGAVYEEYDYNVSPIHACRSNDVEFIDTLMQYGYDKIKLLILAAECDSIPIVIHLIENSSDLSVISDYAICNDFKVNPDGSVEYLKCIMEH